MLVEIDPRPYQAALDQANAKKDADEANLKNAAAQPGALQDARRKGFRLSPAGRHATGDGRPAAAQIKGDQAAVDNAQTELSYTTIKAPLSGKTGFRLVDPGNIVHASGTAGIVTIVKLQPISVVFTAPEEDVPRINKALAAGDVPVTR